MYVGIFHLFTIHSKFLGTFSQKNLRILRKVLGPYCVFLGNKMKMTVARPNRRTSVTNREIEFGNLCK